MGAAALRFIPRGAHQTLALSSVVRITGIAFGWIGSTTAFRRGGQEAVNKVRAEIGLD